MRTEQITNLTGLRAFAAISVLMLHVRWGTLADAYEPFTFLFKNEGLGVDVFFVLSGFILAYVHANDFAQGITAKGTFAFLWARLARIWPIHIFMLVTTALVLPRFVLYDWSPADSWPMFAANVFLIHAWGVTRELTFNQASWSISAEWFAYLLFPALAFFTRDFKAKGYLVLMLVCLFVVSQIEHDLLRYGMMAIKCAVYFFAGYSAYKLTILMPESKYWRIVAHSMLPLIIFMLWLKPFYFKVLFPFLVVALIASLFRSGKIWIYSNPVSVYLGKISFSLYMCHIMVFFSYRQIAGGVQPLRVEIPMIFLAAIILYHVVEEPSRKLMRKIYGQTRKGKVRDTVASGAIG